MLLPIGFAHRGARLQARENTLKAFRMALEQGSPGLESDAWLSADGTVVLDHDGLVGPPWRRRPISQLPRHQLPAHIPSLGQLYDTCGTAFELSLDLKDPAVADGLVAAAQAADAAAPGRLWLCHPDPTRLAALRQRYPQIRLVHSTSLRPRSAGPRATGILEGVAAAAVEAGIDAVNLRADQWTAARVALVHQAGLLALGWDAQRTVTLERLLSAGIDGVYCDDVRKMMASLQRHGQRPVPERRLASEKRKVGEGPDAEEGFADD